jgi:hypothetical protein
MKRSTLFVALLATNDAAETRAEGDVCGRELVDV